MRKKSTRLIGAMMAMILTSSMMVMNVSAKHTAVYTTAGDSGYQGNETMVTNMDFSIAYPDTLLKGAQTGLPVLPEANGIQTMSEDGLGDIQPHCRTLYLEQQYQPYNDGISTQNEMAPALHQVGDTKDIWVTAYGKGVGSVDGNLKVKMVCTTVGVHCTVWYPQDTSVTADGARIFPDVTYPAENVAQKFDEMYEDMLTAFGSPENNDVDGDGKVALMLDMSAVSEPNTLGYFWPRDMVNPQDYSSEEDGYDEYYKYGNNIDMLSLNSLALNEELINNFYNTLAHEFQHMINNACVDYDKSESWLNETFSQNAPEVCGLENLSRDTYTNYYANWIAQKGRTIPFIFAGDYVPRTVYEGDLKSDGISVYTEDEAEAANTQIGAMASLVYAPWYLFGRYLSVQTQDAQGGGDNIYKQLLDSGVCTRESLTETLADMGIISANTEEAFAQFVENFNLALYLQQSDGIYSFEESNVTDFKWPDTWAVGTDQQTLLGGGAAVVQRHPDTDSFTPLSGAADTMSYAGIDKNVLDGPGECTPSGAVAYGSQVTFGANDASNEVIRYTLTTDGTEPSDPTVDSTLYSGPLTITEDCRVKVATFDIEGRRSQNILSLSYQVTYDIQETTGSATGNTPGGTTGPGTTPGAGGTTGTSGGTRTFTCQHPYEEETFGGVKVDGNLVARNYYTVTSGSTIVTFKEEFLKTLSEGEHKLEFIYKEGEEERAVATTFTIEKKEVLAPGGTTGTTGSGTASAGTKTNAAVTTRAVKTGDSSHMMLWTVIMGSAAAVILIVCYRRKQGYR